MAKDIMIRRCGGSDEQRALWPKIRWNGIRLSKGSKFFHYNDKIYAFVYNWSEDYYEEVTNPKRLRLVTKKFDKQEKQILGKLKDAIDHRTLCDHGLDKFKITDKCSIDETRIDIHSDTKAIFRSYRHNEKRKSPLF